MDGLNVGIDDLFADIAKIGGKKEEDGNTAIMSQGKGGIPEEEDVEVESAVKDEEDTDDSKTKDNTKVKEDKEDTDSTSVKNEEDTDDVEDEQGTTDTKESPYKVIATLLKEKNVIEEVPEDIEEDDDYIANLVNITNKKRVLEAVKEYKDTLPDEIKYLLENYEEGVPLMELIEREKTVAEYSSIDKKSLKDNDSLKKSIVTDYLVKTGLPEAKAKAKVEKFETSGILDDEADEALDQLIEIEKQETQAFIENQKRNRTNAIKAEQDRVKSLETEINNRKEAIAGFEWTKEDKKRIFKAMTEVAGKTKDGRPLNKINKYILENPDFQYVIADIIELREGKLDSIKAKATTDATKGVKKNLSGDSKKKGVLSEIDVASMKRALKIK